MFWSSKKSGTISAWRQQRLGHINIEIANTQFVHLTANTVWPDQMTVACRMFDGRRGTYEAPPTAQSPISTGTWEDPDGAWNTNLKRIEFHSREGLAGFLLKLQSFMRSRHLKRQREGQRKGKGMNGGRGEGQASDARYFGLVDRISLWNLVWIMKTVRAPLPKTSEGLSVRVRTHATFPWLLPTIIW